LKTNKTKEVSEKAKIQLIVQICKLYYESNATQQQIADLYKLPRTSIVRIIEAGRQLGIVQTRIVDPYSSREDLEIKIQQHFNLKDVIVVSNFNPGNPVLPTLLGQAAVEYIMGILVPNQTIGLGWGKTISSFVSLLGQQDILKYREFWVPLIGNLGETEIEFNMNQQVKSISEKTGGYFTSIHAPALVDSKQMKNLLTNSSSIKNTIDFWSHLDIAIVGIGGLFTGRLSHMPLLHLKYYPQEDRNEVFYSSAVGDILSRYYDIEGNICDISINSRIIGIDIEALRKVPLTIGIAGGAYKTKAIIGALRGQYINTLITDETAAIGICDYVEKNP